MSSCAVRLLPQQPLPRLPLPARPLLSVPPSFGVRQTHQPLRLDAGLLLCGYRGGGRHQGGPGETATVSDIDDI